MTIYLPDTNCLLAYLRKNKLAHHIDTQYAPFADENMAVISAVNVGELQSISLQSNWGSVRRIEFAEFLKLFRTLDINYASIVQRYAEIDAFSQNKLSGKPLGISSRNMGKNDLWIAATASVLKATLITTDKDFDHLHGVFVDVLWLDPTLYY